jgi:hypothetical protein
LNGIRRGVVAEDRDAKPHELIWMLCSLKRLQRLLNEKIVPVSSGDRLDVIG